MDYTDVIKSKLDELEKAHDIHILFACESGSRAWGFPSTDSDYDARFIYRHRQDWYLSIHEKRDVVELPVDKLLDINGWDLRKALRLIYKHNAVISEWIQSPIVYVENASFVQKFSEVAAAYFSPRAALHHYLSCATKYYEECAGKENIKLKKLLYCIRVTLAALWIALRQTMPPMELEKLLVIVEDPPIVARIKELVHLKKQKDESYQHPSDPTLEHFLRELIAKCENLTPSLPSSIERDDTQLNSFFRTLFS